MVEAIHEHRSERNYNSALWVEGAFSSEIRDPGPRRSLLRGAPTAWKWAFEYGRGVGLY